MADEEDKRGGGKIPTWSGKLSELPEYKRRVRLYRLGTAPDRRKLLGPRLLEALASHPAAWQYAPQVDEALLIEEFETVCGNGAVNSVRFSERRDCAWVELRDESMAEKAVGPMHDLEVLGRRMNVDRTGHLSKKAKGRA